KNQKYEDEILRKLESFKNAQEWTDFISLLNSLNSALTAYECDYVPHKVLLYKRLSQCLHPTLPAGVHSKVLKTYRIIFSKMNERMGIDCEEYDDKEDNCIGDNEEDDDYCYDYKFKEYKYNNVDENTFNNNTQFIAKTLKDFKTLTLGFFTYACNSKMSVRNTILDLIGTYILPNRLLVIENAAKIFSAITANIELENNGLNTQIQHLMTRLKAILGTDNLAISVWKSFLHYKSLRIHILNLLLRSDIIDLKKEMVVADQDKRVDFERKTCNDHIGGSTSSERSKMIIQM
ncbi:Protein dopey-2, partial [Dictyocoela roeselum]